jgi:hypothetical protein
MGGRDAHQTAGGTAGATERLMTADCMDGTFSASTRNFMGLRNVVFIQEDWFCDFWRWLVAEA